MQPRLVLEFHYPIFSEHDTAEHQQFVSLGANLATDAAMLTGFLLFVNCFLIDAYTIPNRDSLNNASSYLVPLNVSKSFVSDVNDDDNTSTLLDPGVLRISESYCNVSPTWYPEEVSSVQFEADCYAAAQQLFFREVHRGKPDELVELITRGSKKKTPYPLLLTPRKYVVRKFRPISRLLSSRQADGS